MNPNLLLYLLYTGSHRSGIDGMLRYILELLEQPLHLTDLLEPTHH
jgi:hypothetical protein